jgi:DNA-binding CsgD family transcriptional regulator
MRQKTASAAATPDEAMSRLAESLVREAANTKNDGRGVLVDLEIDGVRCVVVRSGGELAAEPRPRARNEQLSPRELEIARLIAQGHPNKTIAAVLEISSWTVNTYLRRMFAKLGVTSRAAMVAKLLRAQAGPDQ